MEEPSYHLDGGRRRFHPRKNSRDRLRRKRVRYTEENNCISQKENPREIESCVRDEVTKLFLLV